MGYGKQFVITDIYFIREKGFEGKRHRVLTAVGTHTNLRTPLNWSWNSQVDRRNRKSGKPGLAASPWVISCPHTPAKDSDNQVPGLQRASKAAPRSSQPGFEIARALASKMTSESRCF